jgi:diguanylate cyclase
MTRVRARSESSAGRTRIGRAQSGSSSRRLSSGRASSFGLALVLVVLAGFSLTSAYIGHLRATEVTQAEYLDNAYRDARINVVLGESIERKYRLQPSPAVRAQYGEALDRLHTSLDKILSAADPSAKEGVTRALADFVMYRDGVGKLFDAADAGDIELVNAIDRAEVDPPSDAITEFVQEQSVIQAEATNSSLERMKRTQSTIFLATPIAFIVGFLVLAAFTLNLRNVRRRVEYQTLHDELTGLPNRTLLHDRTGQALASARRSGVTTAVLLIDLDRFREINDTLGHGIGDAVITTLAQRLQDRFRDSDTLARLGGDEFAVLLTNLSGLHAAREVAAEILLIIQKPIEIEELSLDVEASIGIAVAPDHGASADDLVQRADVALYVAKSNHTGYAMYEAHADEYSPERLAVLGDLRRAISEDALVLHYQPKIGLGNGITTGVEALVRWNHPSRGLIPPDEFIPLAERTSLIEPLTDWVLKTAMTQARRWSEDGLTLPIAINISARSLIDQDFATRVHHLLAETGVSPDLIELEVTESAIMTDPIRARYVLEQLHDLDLRLAIDDFGTGYSSLAYLRDLPIDVLKIDQLFIRDMLTRPADHVIVRSVIELARNLGLETVAEGVEDADTAADLAANGCTVGQGYFWSRPLTAEAFVTWHVAQVAQTGATVTAL